MRSYLSEEAFSVFISNKYLVGAITIKSKKQLDDGSQQALDQLKQ
jgi:hypothetical protein